VIVNCLKKADSLEIIALSTFYTHSNLHLRIIYIYIYELATVALVVVEDERIEDIQRIHIPSKEAQSSKVIQQEV